MFVTRNLNVDIQIESKWVGKMCQAKNKHKKLH